MRLHGFMRITWHLTALAALASACTLAAAQGEYLLYVGSDAASKGQGIYAWHFDAAAGKLNPLGLAAEATKPSFLAIHPNRKWLYTTNEVEKGAVSAYSMDLVTGKLTLLNMVSSMGAGPCYITIDRTGRNVLVANYDSGSFAVLPIKPDGSLAEASAFVQDKGGSGVVKDRQEGPHAHCLIPSPDNRFALGADLGLDQVEIFRFNPVKGSLDPNKPPFGKVAPGAGPRHLDFSPDGKHLYVIDEMGSTVTVFRWNGARGALKEVQAISTLPKDFRGRSTCAEVYVHPNGRFLYGSNRGHDSIAVFGINPSKGTLTPIEFVPTGGKTPRNFAIDPSGEYLLAGNQRSGNVMVFRIDGTTGHLAATGEKVEVPSPACLMFVK